MPEETTTKLLPVFPLQEAVILPHMLVTTAVDSDEARAAVEAAKGGDRLLLVVPRVDGRYANVGTVARLEESGRLPNGLEAAVLQGQYRGVLTSAASEAGGALWIRVEHAPDEAPTARAKELAREYRAVIENLLESRGAPGVIEAIRGIDDPGQLADMSGFSPDLSIEQKVETLETLDLEARLEKLIAWAKESLAAVSLKDKIRSEVNESMNKRQREFILRQQMDAIRKELGEEGDDVVSEYRARVAEKELPEGVRKEVEREIGRLERMPEQNPEHGWIRTYLDTVLDLPWGERSEDTFDIKEARKILDEDHTGLDDVKERIIEFLAVRNRRASRNLQVIGGRGSGAIISLIGPPGVGKTSLGESVARALGRKFARVSLGGIHDEAEIRGHRRTYVGALPGRIVRALREAGTMNPVIMLDEIDKVGADWRGDPSSALLEVLDPAQNHSFRDHYLDVELDLSDVLFIPTANVSETIPAPLLDRMELIRLDGYTEDEKLAIAKDHLVRRQLDRNGLEPDEVALTDDALRHVITDHTLEAGVRNLERQVGKVLRKAATKLDTGEVAAPLTIDVTDLRDYLGRPRFQHEAAERTAVPGVATGLAVTGTGGDVLFVEAAVVPGESGLALTGQLGDVMKESAQIALAFVQSHREELGIPEDAQPKHQRYHVHVPAGAVPKDGPSAGVTMVTALASLLSGRSVRGTVGMTGEVTLQGKVLPIGGVKQKLLAAHRAGLKEVILPQRNEPDLDDVPQKVREELEIHLVGDVAEVVRLALEPVAQAGSAAA
ncbi:MAG TPA: endopeptidase La [Candidatus Dormibacteraeota bacterium]